MLSLSLALYLAQNSPPPPPQLGHFGAALAAIVRSDVGGNIDRLERARRRGQEARSSGQTPAGGEGSAAPSTSSSSCVAASSDPSFRLLFSIPLDEIERGADLGAKSDAKGLLWLKRANDFILLMLENLLKGTEEEMKGTRKEKEKSASSPPLSVSAAARAAYNDTLRKYHGMLTAAAFSAALSVRREILKFPLLFSFLLVFFSSSLTPCFFPYFFSPHSPPLSGQLAPSRATFFSAVSRSSNGGRNSGGESGSNDEARVLPSLSAFLAGFGPVLTEIDEWFTAKGLNDPAKV